MERQPFGAICVGPFRKGKTDERKGCGMGRASVGGVKWGVQTPLTTHGLPRASGTLALQGGPPTARRRQG